MYGRIRCSTYVALCSTNVSTEESDLVTPLAAQVDKEQRLADSLTGAAARITALHDAFEQSLNNSLKAQVCRLQGNR